MKTAMAARGGLPAMVLLALTLVSPCPASAQQRAPDPDRAPPAFADFGWEAATPSSAGFDAVALEALA